MLDSSQQHLDRKEDGDRRLHSTWIPVTRAAWPPATVGVSRPTFPGTVLNDVSLALKITVPCRRSCGISPAACCSSVGHMNSAKHCCQAYYHVLIPKQFKVLL